MDGRSVAVKVALEIVGHIDVTTIPPHGSFAVVFIAKQQFDFIWCSHTLEHVLNPRTFLQTLRANLVFGGVLGIVVPYPDTGDVNAHVASAELGTRRLDNAESFRKYLEAVGFEIIFSKFDSFREDEIWIALKKI